MIATLTKRAEALEAAFWAKADPVKIPVEDECTEFYLSVWPFCDVIYDRWMKDDSEALRIHERIQRIEQEELPVHPAFLKGEHEVIRQAQWAKYHSAACRELHVRLSDRLLAEVAPHYDGKAMGLCGIALRLFEKEIDGWMDEYEYMGIAVSREEMACNQIELWKTSELIRHKAGYPEDQKTREELWRRSCIEYEEYCYGRKITEEELLIGWKMAERLREDMAGGKPASESEAAQYFRDIHERYPRKPGLSTYEPGV